MKDQSLTIHISHTEDDNKKQLQKLILDKRKLLVKLLTKTEMLRVELDMVKQEYDVRVGKLYVTSNQQDLDIIYYRNLLDLLEKGMDYEKAVKKLEETYYAEQRRIAQEKEEMRQQERIFRKRSEAQKKPQDKNLRRLWKYLVSKFHPDLVQDPKEKKHREQLMKQINRAYEEQDYDKLKQLENEVHIDSYEESTIERLTQILVEVENEIIQQENAYQVLKNSEWYRWKIQIQKAKRKDEDVFLDIERNLLNEMVKKYNIINALKEQIDEMKKQSS